jgi:hypothetical protein
MSYVAFQFPVYRPQMMAVIGITNANPAVVTTSLDGVNPGNHNYINGLIVRIDMAPGFGMQEINQQFSDIIVLSPTTFAINIDTTLYSAFFAPVTYPLDAQYCQANPFAELTSQITGALNNVLPL